MKKLVLVITCLAVMILCCGNALAIDQQTAQEHQIICEAYNDMLPLRYIAENSGYTVQWNEDETIVLKKDDLTIQVQINNDDIAVNGESINLKYTPVLIGDKTYLPVEFYSSLFTEKYITRTGENSYTLLDKTPVSAKNMMDSVQEISQYPRHISDATHAEAMQYVIDKFTEYGYEVKKQEFEYEALDWDTGKLISNQGTNLIVVKKADTDPTGDVLILGAHYDGVAGVSAANDNGSGLSVLLELARVLHDLPTDTEIRFVAFDAEEDGLCGSKEYVKQLTDAKNIIGMINFDMLGGAKAGQVGVHTAGERDCYLVDILRLDYEFCDVERETHPGGMSDHMPFPARLIPAIDFSHASIWDEYHSENDIAENISADMLEYAAKGGAAIASTIMSNTTPSYLDYAKPKENSEIFEITPETYIPVVGMIEQLQRELKIPLTQIESSDSSLKYRVKVKLLDFDQPLDMVYDAPIGSWGPANPHIDLTNSGISYDEIKAVFDEKFDGGTQVGDSETYYIYNSIYGNRYFLFYSTEGSPEISISIGLYQDNEIEAYLIEKGELIRLDSTDLTTVYEITKTKDGVSVTETLPKASKDLEVSDKAQKCWGRMKSIMSDEELNEFSYFVLESDGFGHQIMNATDNYWGGISVEIIGYDDVEIPEEYKSLPENVQSFIKYMLTKAEEGDKRTASRALPGQKLSVDYNDLLNKQGSAYADTDLVKAFAVMKGTALFDRQNQVDQTQEYLENGTPFEKITYNMKRGSQMYAFAEQFYQEIYSTERYNIYDLFSKYPNEFVTAEAALSISNDMAYSFAEFVVRDEPTGSSIKEQKIRFFYSYPDLVTIREQLRQHILN